MIGLEKVIEENRQPMEHEVYEFLEFEGIKFPPYLFVPKGANLADAIEELNPDQFYVCKAMSPKILHKSDLKAVRLKIAKDEIHEIKAEFLQRFEDYDYRGMLIVPMAEDGIELLLGSTIDDSFGTITVFGIGGTLVEIVKDVTFGKCPLDKSDAMLMINSLKNKEMLNGPRGLPKADLEELRDLLIRLSYLSCKYEEKIKEIDLNPIRITSKGLVPLDARVILQKFSTKDTFH